MFAELGPRGALRIRDEDTRSRGQSQSTTTHDDAQELGDTINQQKKGKLQTREVQRRNGETLWRKMPGNLATTVRTRSPSQVRYQHRIGETRRLRLHTCGQPNRPLHDETTCTHSSNSDREPPNGHGGPCANRALRSHSYRCSQHVSRSAHTRQKITKHARRTHHSHISKRKFVSNKINYLKKQHGSSTRDEHRDPVTTG